MKGLIFDIQGHSVHDGPGCRTLVFLSGCPLHCEWCSNPEGQSLKQPLLFSIDKCKHIHYRCVDACPHAAISINQEKDKTPVFNRLLCDKCDNPVCAEVCLFEAINLAGKYYSPDELLRILKRDQGFWDSKGGVSFTGGEPLLQKDFLLEILKKCRSEYIHTVIETSAYADTEIFQKVLELTHWMFIDIKHMDPLLHKEKTGVDNVLILKNIEYASSSGWDGRLVIRLAIIPGFNDTEENLRKTAEFMKKNKLQEINLLPFHRYGNSKYTQLGKKYEYSEILSPSEKDMLSYRKYFDNAGINCYVDCETPF
ncbi:glycyl-radical enzyme activating protein [Bacteroidota bacterium]